jgi:hypothetical protein
MDTLLQYTPQGAVPFHDQNLSGSLPLRRGGGGKSRGTTAYHRYITGNFVHINPV